MAFPVDRWIPTLLARAPARTLDHLHGLGSDSEKIFFDGKPEAIDGYERSGDDVVDQESYDLSELDPQDRARKQRVFPETDGLKGLLGCGWSCAVSENRCRASTSQECD